MCCWRGFYIVVLERDRCKGKGEGEGKVIERKLLKGVWRMFLILGFFRIWKEFLRIIKFFRKVELLILFLVFVFYSIVVLLELVVYRGLKVVYDFGEYLGC